MFSQSQGNICIDYAHHPIHREFENSSIAAGKLPRSRGVKAKSSEDHGWGKDSSAPDSSVKHYGDAMGAISGVSNTLQHQPSVSLWCTEN